MKYIRQCLTSGTRLNVYYKIINPLITLGTKKISDVECGS